MGAYLDFQKISEAVKFKDLLDSLNISYSVTETELKGEGFIVNLEKNLFINPLNKEQKGSVINFLSINKGISLREAAAELQKQFMTEKPKELPPSDIPQLTLEYHDVLTGYGFSKEFCQAYEFGYCKQKSIMAGKIAFLVRDKLKQVTGYIGVSLKDNKWHFPKKFSLSVYNIHRCMEKTSVILVVNPLDALKVISFGWLQTVAILTPSMTKEQEEDLKRFKQILVIHKEPDNIAARLSNHSFVRKIIPPKELTSMTKEEFIEILK